MDQPDPSAVLDGHRGFNRDPHFQRVMGGVCGTGQGMDPRFNRDPHFQRVMAELIGDIGVCADTLQ